jgi:hypothetical protein
MAFTYEVNSDKSVTILNDGYVFSTQVDDPTVEGFEPFATTAAAEAWAETAIARYEEEILNEHVASEAATAAAEAEAERDIALIGSAGEVEEAPSEEPAASE